MHNEPLQLTAETSVVGFIFYAALFGLLSWRFLIAFHSSKETTVKLRLIFAMMAIVSFIMNSLFTFPVRMAIPPLFLMVILGLLVSLDLNTMKETNGLVFPVKNATINSLVVLFSLFAIFLTVFNFRMILADRHYLRSSYFNRVKDWRLARIEAQKAADYIPWRYKIWFELGKAADHLGLDDEAIEAYIRALEVHPNHINSLLNLGHVHLKKGDYNRVAQHTLKAVNIKPDFDMALFNMALMNDRQGRIKEALEYYQRAIKANPTYAEAYFGLGILFLKRERLSESRHHLERAIELKPHMMGVHFNLGLVYDRLKKPEKAIVEYKKEIELNPKSAEAYTNLGLISAKEKEWREAISLYQRAIRINPDLGAAHVNMAVAYYVLRNYDSAWKHTRIAERLGLPQAKILIRRLSKISKEPE
jgi:tetratricopeptide (TPR) repeat protein